MCYPQNVVQAESTLYQIQTVKPHFGRHKARHNREKSDGIAADAAGNEFE